MKRLIFSIALALAVHGLIFYFDGEWLKNKPYHQVSPAFVTISLTSLPPANTPTVSQPLQTHDKKAGNKHENQSGKTERLPERPVSRPDLMDASTQTDIPSVSDSMEANAVTDFLPSLVGKGTTEKDPKNRLEVPEQAYDRAAGEMHPVINVVKEAVPLYKENPAPVYPLQAKKRGYEGIVILEVLVTKEGRAGKVSVFQSSRYSLLDKAAVLSVKKWRFEPGKRGDKMVDMPVKIPIRFQLESEE
ncbi:MAG: energy transducer TonB [Proteobacteria bacterium]|nr:energy transducer TonB [Pseudomonadota bacterium]